MKILFFNRSYYPDTSATGQLLTDLCEGLVQKHGHRVSVVAGPSLLPASEQPLAGRGGLFFRRESRRGVAVLRAKGTRFSKRRFPGRFSNYVTYFFSACVAGLRVDRPDVVVALTDPPIIGLAAVLASGRFRAPFVMSYRDVFPEAARLLEDFHSPIVDSFLLRVNRFLVRRADRVVALGETMRRRLIEGKGADPVSTVVIPDWADCSQITPGPKENPFSRRHGLADKFVVMHSGNIGLSQGLDALVEAAARLAPYADIRIVLVGEGAAKASLEARARSLNLSNVLFLPYQPKERLTESFAAADVFVVSLKRGLSGVIVPSKLYGILAAGRPFIAAVEEDCEAALIAAQHRCGLPADPENPADLAEKVLVLYQDSGLRRQMAENARRAALLFDRSVGVGAYAELFHQLTGS